MKGFKGRLSIEVDMRFYRSEGKATSLVATIFTLWANGSLISSSFTGAFPHQEGSFCPFTSIHANIFTPRIVATNVTTIEDKIMLNIQIEYHRPSKYYLIHSTNI